jgi:hypothetical protein
MISNPTGSSDINPRVSPENRAESKINPHPRRIDAVCGKNGSCACSHPADVKQSVAHDASAVAPHAAMHASSVVDMFAREKTRALAGRWKRHRRAALERRAVGWVLDVRVRV